MEIATTMVILDALPNPVLLLDSQKTIVAANSAAKELLGAEIEGRSLAIALRHPEILDAVNAVIADEQKRQISISLLASVWRSFDIQIASLMATNESTADAILTMHDTTATRNADQMRADFVANVSHELRSPLSSLIGFIETLRGAARDDVDARDRFLGIMDNESKRMARLIDDLLSLSKVEASEHILPNETVDIFELLAEVRDTLSERAAERHIDVNLPTLNGKYPVLGNRDELMEVFLNLIDNAVKYCPENTSISVDIERISRIPDRGGPGIMVSVADQGDGISAEHLPRLTERFYRVDRGRSRTMGGTGLGLAIVKHIVNRHRGRLAIDSIVGEGTIFRVYLPSEENTEATLPS